MKVVVTDKATGREGNEVDQIKGSKIFHGILVPNSIANFQIRSDAVLDD